MGHSSKKKKKSKGGRGRGRAPSKDHASQLDDDQDALNEELTALAAIFQEDFKIVSELPHVQFEIKLRPYSDDTGFDDLNVSALLHVRQVSYFKLLLSCSIDTFLSHIRCLPGYPHKCPKLQIVPEKGLSEKDADQLLALLVDQANINAREGRVMIFNLVEAAQEFLSEIVPKVNKLKSVLHLVQNKDQSFDGDLNARLEKGSHPEIPCVTSSIDLYGDFFGDTTGWGSHGAKVANGSSNKVSEPQSRPIDKSKAKNIILQSQISTAAQNIAKERRFQNVLAEVLPGAKYGVTPEAETQLNAVEEETESAGKLASINDQDSIADTSEKSYDSAQYQLEDTDIEEQVWKADGSVSDNGSSMSSFASVACDDASLNKKKDLLLVHLLRLACSKGSYSNSLPEISSELCKFGMLSGWARDLVAAPSSNFDKAFDHAFEQHLISSQFSQFWKGDSSLTGDVASSRSNSRYLNDFEEVRPLGHGGFGRVALCKNKLDGRQYAAWFETEYGGYHGESALGSRTADSFSRTYTGVSSKDVTGDNMQESTYLYIQMEYCPRTLRQDFESYSSSFDKDYVWHLFRQIVEGLAHIHSQGIIHRDLTPNNIFFDVRNDIKIGDFGLAKFLKEQLDHDQYFPTEATGVSTDGTGQVAPEVEHNWPQINEKVDMYSLGIIFFELWHPFATAMERHIVLSDLKQKVIPPSWAEKYPGQANLLRRLTFLGPSDRPSAIQLLQHELPPRMEDEWLNDVLRTIQAAEDTYVYDRVVSTIFNEERLIMKSSRQHDSSAKMMMNESFTQSTELDTEIRDTVVEISKEVFKRHCAKRLEISPLNILDGSYPFNRKSVKLLTQGGNILELRHELRTPFVTWIATNQQSSFKRYEVSSVYRRAVGHSTPSRFLQGDFDIIGGTSPITEAEVIKVVMDIATRFFQPNAIDIRLNHGQVLESIWSWVGITHELRQNVAEDLNLSETVVDRLQIADLRFCGSADQAIARLRGALSFDRLTCKALEELSALLSYLRVWSIEQHVSIDVLMPPTEVYHSSLFFQVYLKESLPGSSTEATLLAVGGRYDHLMQQYWDQHISGQKTNPSGAVGVSIALEKIPMHCSVDIRPPRIEPSISVLVCSRGSGGLLLERMEFVAELWQANIKAEFVPQPDPSLKEQYEYASDHDIKCLIIITEASLSQTEMVKFRHLELKKEKEVKREDIVKFLLEAISTQFRNLANWNSSPRAVNIVNHVTRSTRECNEIQTRRPSKELLLLLLLLG
ncbi:putative serine/threonine-protein kinase GCN2 [Ananas comosus]|uniref:non-specific serine/threonine protein kinase n=1 Tax=Ananas comosus TaxID=4615 RepID=A0A199ULX7_ANACO|nr:putative serine/threonine-protein kinase GCN2 [Ananas comosus]